MSIEESIKITLKLNVFSQKLKGIKKASPQSEPAFLLEVDTGTKATLLPIFSICKMSFIILCFLSECQITLFNTKLYYFFESAK
jgi:hypothetical protein